MKKYENFQPFFDPTYQTPISHTQEPNIQFVAQIENNNFNLGVQVDVNSFNIDVKVIFFLKLFCFF